MSMTTDRRSFLFGASVAGFGVLVQGKRSLAWGVGPNDTLNIACIGVGGKGQSDTEHAALVGRVVAVCDIDQERLDKMAGRQKESKKFNDYRELLARAGRQDRCGDRLDARPHARPGCRHGHAHGQARVLPEAAGAVGLGSRLMRETARQKGVCTQMGNQGTADSGFPAQGRAGASGCASAR